MQGLNFQKLAAEKGIDLDQELTKGFAARYIRRKARQLVGKARFTASDRPEIEQELRIRLLRRLPRFDPTKSCWQTFVKSVVWKRAASLLAGRRVKKRESNHRITSLSRWASTHDGEWVELSQILLPEHQEAVTGRSARPDHEYVDLSHDVAAVLSRLPEKLRQLCQRLQTGSIRQVAEELGVPYSTLHDRVRKLRQTFEEAGLKKDEGRSVNARRIRVGRRGGTETTDSHTAKSPLDKNEERP